MKPNIGRLDAYFRISAGFTLLAYSTARLIRKPNQGTPLVMAMIGGMKVAEGITRFCPLVYAAENKFMNMEHHCCYEDDAYHQSHHEDGSEVVNPS